MGDVFRIYLKDLTTTPAVNPNDPLAGALPNSAPYWGEGEGYQLGVGIRKLYDAICDPAHEPVIEGGPLEHDSVKVPQPGKPGSLMHPPTVFSSPRAMKPKHRYPATPFTSSDFWWDPQPAAVTGASVLIYCVRTQAESVIVKRTPAMVAKLGGGGTTHTNALGTISEVYVETILTAGGVGTMLTLINIAFHETMHNKLKLDNALHNDRGLAAGVNMGTDLLNDKNIRTMRAALATVVIQDTSYL